MLWSLSIIHILFAEKSKAKINANIFRFKTFIFFNGLSSVKIVPVSSIEIIRKGAHLPWGPLCVDTSLPPSAHI